jgi:hypothetical protein
MSGYVAYVFTAQQLTDIRRFCGYPAAANGQVLFPAPWVNVQYLALDYRLQTLSTTEGGVVVTTYLTNLYALETATIAATTNMGTDVAAVWTRNRNEYRDRCRQFDDVRRRLCEFMGVQPGPGMSMSGGMTMVV